MCQRLTIFLVFLSTLLQAQQPRFFRHFTEKDGLSSSYVTCILRDREGFLWVGTNYGLNRFDGRRFRQYLPDAKAPESTVCNEYISSIGQDSAGYIWIATRNGLNRYDPATGKFKTWLNTGRNDGSLPNSMTTDLFMDGPRIWIACDNRDLTYFDTRTATFKSFPWKTFAVAANSSTAGLDYKTIYGFDQRKGSLLWLNTNLGRFTFDLVSEQFTYDPYPVPVRVNHRPETCPDVQYFGSWDADVLRFDGCRRQWSQLRLPISASIAGGFRFVTRIKQQGPLHWVLSQQGLFALDPVSETISAVKPDVFNRFTAPTGFLQAIFTEPDGTAWFGGENGLWQLDPNLQHFQNQPIDTARYASLVNRYVRFLDVPGLNRRFVCDLYKGRLLVFEKDKWLKTIELGGTAGVLHQDKSGVIWTVGGAKVFHLNPQTLQLTPFLYDEKLLQPAKNTRVIALDEDAAGNLWLCTNNRGVLVFHKKEGVWRKPGAAVGLISENLNCLLADPVRKTVWLGSDDYGLFRYDELSGQFKLYRREEENLDCTLGAYMVMGLCRDGLGRIWVATDPGGISRFDYDAPENCAFVSLDTRNGLPSNQATTLVTDHNGNIWAGTTKGLAWVDARTLRLRSWNKNSGMLNEFIDLPLSAGADGALMFGGNIGYERFYPDSLLKETDDPRILLSSFKVFDRELIGSFEQHITLGPQDNFFSVEFSAANFSRPEKNEYAVRLSDFDADWKPCGTRGYAAWTNVPPGDYMLEIRTIREGKALESGTRIRLTILPPYWKTWWFRLSVILLAGALIWGFYRFRVAQIRHEEQLKTEFNRRIAQVEMSALRAQMNPHFVFNCLNSINRFILLNDPETASGYLTKFSRLIRLILDNSRTETVPLDKELEALRLYIDMETMRFDGRFSYQITVDPHVQTEHREVPPLLIQPYVENAIWHGLMQKKEPGMLWIRIFEQNNILHLEVEDNGIGRVKAHEIKSKSAVTHKSHGMQVTAERLDIIRNLYGMEANVAIEDLQTESGLAAGTLVKITIS
jgi:ligand-binding sensor domain-containing protein